MRGEREREGDGAGAYLVVASTPVRFLPAPPPAEMGRGVFCGGVETRPQLERGVWRWLTGRRRRGSPPREGTDREGGVGVSRGWQAAVISRGVVRRRDTSHKPTRPERGRGDEGARGSLVIFVFIFEAIKSLAAATTTRSDVEARFGSLCHAHGPGAGKEEEEFFFPKYERHSNQTCTSE